MCICYDCQSQPYVSYSGPAWEQCQHELKTHLLKRMVLGQAVPVVGPVVTQWGNWLGRLSRLGVVLAMGGVYVGL